MLIFSSYFSSFLFLFLSSVLNFSMPLIESFQPMLAKVVYRSFRSIQPASSTFQTFDNMSAIFCYSALLFKSKSSDIPLVWVTNSSNSTVPVREFLNPRAGRTWGSATIVTRAMTRGRGVGGGTTTTTTSRTPTGWTRRPSAPPRWGNSGSSTTKVSTVNLLHFLPGSRPSLPILMP